MPDHDGSDHDGTRNMSGRQFAIFIQVSNRGIFCQYISLPTKYTISGSTLQYNMGLTMSFSSLISRGVGPFQKGNTSIDRGVTFLDCTRQVYNLGNGGVPVHHDPVDGICTNHEK